MIFQKTLLFLSKIKAVVLFQIRLKPKILKLKNLVEDIVRYKADFFPMGKSIFVINGDFDIMYFIIYRDDESASVLEVYDEKINRIPEKYDYLKRIPFQEIVQSI